MKNWIFNGVVAVVFFGPLFIPSVDTKTYFLILLATGTVTVLAFMIWGIVQGLRSPPGKPAHRR